LAPDRDAGQEAGRPAGNDQTISSDETIVESDDVRAAGIGLERSSRGEAGVELLIAIPSPVVTNCLQTRVTLLGLAPGVAVMSSSVRGRPLSGFSEGPDRSLMGRGAVAPPTGRPRTPPACGRPRRRSRGRPRPPAPSRARG